jgi:protein-disulfide isomerase
MSASRKRLITKLLIVTSAASLAVIFACTGESKAKEKPNYVTKEGQGPAGAMASIDGKPINEEELMGDEKLEFLDAMKKIYDLRYDRVGKILLEKVYGEEAKKAGVSIEEYVDSKVLKGDAPVSEREYDKFVKEKKIPKEQLNPQLKERIMSYMKAMKKQDALQNLVVKLSKEHKVELYFGKPNFKVNIEIGQAPTFGGKDAKVKIVEFSDFQCPFCGRAAATVTEIKKMYGKKIQFAFKQYPLPMHSQAKPASEASMCVNEQGSEKFWKYHDKLFQNSDKLDSESLKKFAKDIGANIEQFSKCVDEKKYAKAVQEDIEYGNKLGVRSTPTFFINGRLVSGAQPVESFKEIIDEELSGT